MSPDPLLCVTCLVMAALRKTIDSLYSEHILPMRSELQSLWASPELTTLPELIPKPYTDHILSKTSELYSLWSSFLYLGIP